MAFCTALAGCPKPLPPSTPDLKDDDALVRGCPTPYQLSSAVAETEMLSRVMREGRANLMTRATVDKQEVLATLYHPHLALVEAALNDPKSARAQQPSWLERKLLRTYVELRANRPLDLAAAVHRMSLREPGSGLRYPALELVEQRTGAQGWRARIAFESPDWGAAKRFLSLELVLPGRVQAGTARWGISPRALAQLDRLPIVYELAPLRTVRMARRALLRGEPTVAARLLKEVPACAACYPIAQQLSKLISTMKDSVHAVDPDTEEPGLGNSAPAPGVGSLSIRAALLRQLQRLNGSLIGQEALAKAQRILTEAQQVAEGTTAFGRQIVAFDQQLARVLRQALDPRAAVGSAPSREAPPVNAAVLTELRRRLAYANAASMPHFVDGSKRGKVALSETQPLLEAKQSNSEFTVTARVRRRVGQGWLHPGLPELRYRTRFVDNAQAYWAARVRRALSPADLKKVARDLLKREMRGPDAAAAEAALAGWVALEGKQAQEVLCAIASEPVADRAAAALKALAPFSKEPEVQKLVQRHAGSKDPGLRAAVLVVRGGTQLKRGLRSSSPQIALASLAALLRKGQGIGAARQWLKDGPAARQRATLSLLARSRRGAPAALRPVLAQLFQEKPTLRRLIIQATRGGSYRALLLRAATDEDARVRQVAVRQLAMQPRPLRAVLEAALQDKDPQVKLTAHVGLVRLGQSRSLLALGSGARGGCGQRQVVLEPLVSRMDSRSRRKLLVETLGTADCPEIAPLAWNLVSVHYPTDAGLWRIGLAHPIRRVRVAAALSVLGASKRP